MFPYCRRLEPLGCGLTVMLSFRCYCCLLSKQCSGVKSEWRACWEDEPGTASLDYNFDFRFVLMLIEFAYQFAHSVADFLYSRLFHDEPSSSYWSLTFGNFIISRLIRNVSFVRCRAMSHDIFLRKY